MSTLSSARHGQTVSLRWALVLALVFSLTAIERVLLTRFFVWLQPPLWGVIVGALLVALVTLPLVVWGFVGVAHFVGRAHRPGRAVVGTGALGGLLAGLLSVALRPWELPVREPVVSSHVQVLVTVGVSVLLVHLLARWLAPGPLGSRLTGR